MHKKGPDSLEGWFVALICCLVSTLMYGSAGLSSLLFVASINRYDTDRDAAAFPFILCSALQAATGPFVGYFATKFGERCVLLVGSIFAFVGIATCYLAESILAVTALWGVVFGIGFGFSTLLLPAIINNYFFKNRSAALGICYLGSPIGFLIFPPIFEILMMKFGLSGTFLILAAINMHCIPLSLFLCKPNFKQESYLDHTIRTSKEQFMYLGTGSSIVKQQPLSQNDEIKRLEEGITYNKSRRRISLEFLWHQPYLTEHLSESKQSILSLREKCYGTMPKRKDYSRSFVKAEHSYENFNKSKGPFNLLSPTSLTTDKESEINSREFCFLNELRNHGLENASPADTEIKRKSMESDSSVNPYSKANFLNSNQVHNYKNSTLYCGTYQQPLFINRFKDDSRYNSNSLPNLHSPGTDHLNGNCYQSSEQPKDIYYISSTTSISPLVTNAEGNGTSVFKNDADKKTANFEKESLVKVYCHPIFILMSIANAIYNIQFVTLTTVIIDFSRDHSIDSSYDKFIMMCISLTGALGMMGFGWVTDGGYLSRNKFASLCLLIGSMCTTVLPSTVDFTTLIVVLAFWCLSQSSFVLLIPAIIAEYFDEDTQTVAVSAFNLLCAPLYLIIPSMIGYFRDGQGSYDSIFYLLSGLSLLNSAAVFIVPCLVRTKQYTVNNR